MAETKHTPWFPGDSGDSVWRAEIEDFDYHPKEGCTTFQPITEGDETVCLVVGEGWDDTAFDERVALISAAPEMLNALKLAATYMDRDEGRPENAHDSMVRAHVHQVEAAIAKAEGRS